MAGLDFFADVNDAYGVDEVGLPPQDNDQITQVTLSRMTFCLVEEDLLRLKQLVNPLQQSHNFGIDLYETTLEFVCQCVSLNPSVYS